MFDFPVPPIMEWCGSDVWLRNATQEVLLEQPCVWNSSVCAGMISRLQEEPPIEDQRRMIQDLLAGVPNEELEKVANWVHQLTEEQHEEIEDLALAEEELLGLFLEELRKEYNPECFFWPMDVCSLFHRRDDLASIQVVLRETSKGNRLNAALRCLDEEGLAFVNALPKWLSWDDVRLSRVRQRNPMAWWASKVNFTEEM